MQRKFFAAAMLVTLLAAVALAQPPVLPPDPSPPVPTPPPVPGPQVLPPGWLYPIKGNTPFSVVASPDGYVKIGMDTGPLKARAFFVGGNGTSQTILFSEKYLAFVEGLKSGTIELIVIGQDGNIQRRTITVQMGPAPPGPGPGPTPPDPTDPAWAALKAALAKEAAGDLPKVPALAALYKQLVPWTLAADDPTVITVGDLVAKAAVARKGLIGTALPNLRAAIDAELTKALPLPPNMKLDAATRGQIAAQFQRMADLTAALVVKVK